MGQPQRNELRSEKKSLIGSILLNELLQCAKIRLFSHLAKKTRAFIFIFYHFFCKIVTNWKETVRENSEYVTEMPKY